MGFHCGLWRQRPRASPSSRLEGVTRREGGGRGCARVWVGLGDGRGWVIVTAAVAGSSAGVKPSLFFFPPHLKLFLSETCL